MADEYEVRNAHAKRRCHPETCCCATDFVVVKDGMVIADVDSEEEGEREIDRIKRKNQTTFVLLRFDDADEADAILNLIKKKRIIGTETVHNDDVRMSYGPVIYFP